MQRHRVLLTLVQQPASGTLQRRLVLPVCSMQRQQQVVAAHCGTGAARLCCPAVLHPRECHQCGSSAGAGLS
ncbi:hypothetical protein [Streptomyces murinus]|uniref:hypothetical protein n=1 Tax=Streptomyces murinus TaxID=33900 RepID=UPI0037F32044